MCLVVKMNEKKMNIYLKLARLLDYHQYNINYYLILIDISHTKKSTR